MKKLLFLLLLFYTGIAFAQKTTGNSKPGRLIKSTANTEIISNHPIENNEVKTLGQGEYYTPFLTAEINFQEDNNNNFLDANEDASIKLKIKNIGKMTAKECLIRIDKDRPESEIKITLPTDIFSLLPNEEKEVVIPIRGASLIQNGKAKLIVKIIEKDGFDLDPDKILVIPTRAFQPPQIEIVDYGISDQNRNQKIERFERVDLTFRVQNRGETMANDIKGKIKLGENIMPLDVKDVYDIGNIAPGEYKDVTAIIVTNKRATEVVVTLDLSESTGKYGKSKTFNLPFDVLQKKPEEIVIKESAIAYKDIPDVANLKLDIAENIPVSSQVKENAIAVIIGNKDYDNAPAVEYALNDAMIMKNYVISAFGYKPENIIYLENARQSQFLSVFGNETDCKGQLYSYVKKGLSEVFIYYSGHGAPNPNTGQGYIMPADCDPDHVTLNGYSLNTLYNNLDKIASEKDLKHVTLVLDACFSGNSNNGELIKNISAVKIRLKNDVMNFTNTTMFTSAAGDQVSNWYPDKKQSLFTFFFLKGLKGEADFNKDNKITAQELYQYTADEINGVPYWARRLYPGRTQTPTFTGTDELLYH